jgi:hypothetical protein
LVRPLWSEHTNECGKSLSYEFHRFRAPMRVGLKVKRCAPCGCGDRVAVRLRAWADFSEQYEKINRTEIDDPPLQLEEPVWGELAN